jgi:hypothetical protein
VSANKKKRIDSMIKEWETSIVSTDEFLASSPLTQNSAKHQSQRFSQFSFDPEFSKASVAEAW